MNIAKVLISVTFFAFGVLVLFTNNELVPVVSSYSTGPPAGVTGAPGELTCT